MPQLSNAKAHTQEDKKVVKVTRASDITQVQSEE